MDDNPQPGWEHGRRAGSFASMFENKRGTATKPGVATEFETAAEALADEEPDSFELNAAEYKPWVLQRGRSRPAMLLHLRRFEPKSGFWLSWQVSYPHLIAAEYIGDRMLSLDFGTRQFVIEGKGLDEMARHLQSGSVLLLQEFSKDIWKVQLEGSAMIDSIQKL